MAETISILGCGWYGLPLAKTLLTRGKTVRGSTTDNGKIPILQKQGIEPFLIDLNEDITPYESDFFNSQILIITIPPGRNTGDTYVQKIEKIKKAAQKGNVTQLIFISSTSVYGDHRRNVDESTHPDPITNSGKAMLLAENMLREGTFKTTVLRFGGLVGPERDPGHFFAGKTQIPNGKAPVNLVHLDDCIGITLSVINQKAFGHIFNVVAPHHPEKQEFYTKATQNAGIEKPDFLNELKDWKKVSTSNIPGLLQYEYKINNWTTWLTAGKL